MTTRLRTLLPAAAIVALTAVIAATGLLAPAERLTSDLRTRMLAHEIDSDVLIVAIDAHSLKTLNRWPWSRRIHARLLERLDAARPRAVFFDVDFSVPSGNPAADAALAATLDRRRDHPVILPAFWQSITANARTSRVLTEPMSAFSGPAEVGLVNMFPGADGLVRDAVHRDRFGTRDYRSAAAMLSGRGGFESGAAYPIDFRISPESFGYVSFADVLAGRIPDDVIRNRVVMIGATALELGDSVPVPIHRSLPGVTMQALVYESLERGTVQPLPWIVPMLMVLALVAGWTCLQHRSWRFQVGFVLTAAVGAAGLSLYLHGAHDLLLGVAPPLLALLLCLFTGMILNADRQTLSAMLTGVRLKRQEALISGVFSASIDGILVLTPDGRIADVNPSAARLLGAKPSALTGRSVRVFLPDLKPAVTGEHGLRPGRFEVDLLTPEGKLPVEVSLSPAADDQRGLMTAIVRDVSERRRQQAVLRHQATHDSLTRLPNRMLLNGMLERLPAGGRAALFMLDLDRFKQVNDTLGHGVGDEVLRALGKRLRQSLPDDVKVFRIGGDEFAVLVSRYRGRDELAKLADLIIDRVRAPVPAGGNRLELGASIGIALYPEHAHSGVSLLQCADVAMYTAKAGRGHIAFYDAEIDHNTLRNLKIAGALRTAIESDRLGVVYQPKLALHDRLCRGVEALVRWRDPELGVVSPAEFVPLAETSDLIDALTRATLRHAARDQARWCARGIDLSVSVNLSARHLTDAAFTQDIVKLVRERGLDPASLELEITETALMDDPERARAVLARLTRQGIRLAIDDFGTGFSSLAYLKHLNLHTLKIDRCFIQDLERSHNDRKIVESTLSMAHSLDLSVVAEGIENEGQAAILTELGCELGQGFALAPPMDADAFTEWYLKQRPARVKLHSVTA